MASESCLWVNEFFVSLFILKMLAFIFIDLSLLNVSILRFSFIFGMVEDQILDMSLISGRKSRPLNGWMLLRNRLN